MRLVDPGDFFWVVSTARKKDQGERLAHFCKNYRTAWRSLCGTTLHLASHISEGSGYESTPKCPRCLAKVPPETL